MGVLISILKKRPFVIHHLRGLFAKAKSHMLLAISFDEDMSRQTSFV
jgi:hypothetical protein